MAAVPNSRTSGTEGSLRASPTLQEVAWRSQPHAEEDLQVSPKSGPTEIEGRGRIGALLWGPQDTARLGGQVQPTTVAACASNPTSSSTSLSLSPVPPVPFQAALPMLAPISTTTALWLLLAPCLGHVQHLHPSACTV